MIERSEYDEQIIERGQLWTSFKQTDYYEDLERFFKEQETLGRAAVCDLTIAGKYEESKAAAHKLSGILAVREYISDCIAGMKDQIELEKADKQYRKAIPKHI